MFLMLPQQEQVGHPGYVIANHEVAGNLPGGLLLRFRQRASLMEIVGKQIGEASDGALRILGDERMVVNMREEKALQLGVLSAGRFAEARQALRYTANLFRGLRTRLLDQRFRIGNQVAGQMVDHLAQSFIEFQAHPRAGMRRFDFCVELSEKRDFVAQRVEVKQIGFERVVKVGGVVRNFVDPVDELGFKRRPKIKQILGQFWMRRGRVIPGMLHDAFADFERQIEAVEFDVAVLEVLHDAKRVQVVIEAASVGPHQLVEFALARVAEWRVADIVHQGQRLHEFRVDAQCRGNRAGDLRDFEGVGQPVAKMVGETSAEDLRFCFEPSERPGVNDAVAVASIFATVGVRGFRKPPAAGGRRIYRPGSVGAKRFDCRNLRWSGAAMASQDCGASALSPRSASSATLVFG